MKELIKIQENIIGHYMTENQKKDFVKCINTAKENRHLRYSEPIIICTPSASENVKVQINKSFDLNVKLKTFLKMYK